VIDGRSITPGDAVLGLASSGAHANGYSLIRRILERAGWEGKGPIPSPGWEGKGPILSPGHNLAADCDGRPLADALLAPTRIYVRSVLALACEVRVKGLAHITGGGLPGNVPRILPAGVRAVIDRRAWPQPALFRWLQREGRVADAEMQRVFNCGIGMVAVVGATDVERATKILRDAGETVYRIGAIEPRPEGGPSIEVV